MEAMAEREAAEEAANAELQAKLRAMQEEVAIEVRVATQWRTAFPLPLASAGGVGTHRDSITGGRCRAR
eukprot:COSAG01_NODE_2851_length_6937_cov_13.682228_12_plen_69_part_00